MTDQSMQLGPVPNKVNSRCCNFINYEKIAGISIGSRFIDGHQNACDAHGQRFNRTLSNFLKVLEVCAFLGASPPLVRKVSRIR